MEEAKARLAAGQQANWIAAKAKDITLACVKDWRQCLCNE